MKVYFHHFHTEAHRRWSRQRAFLDALLAEGVDCTTQLEEDCEVALCASVEAAEGFRAELRRHEVFRERRRPPVVQFCWDLYPFHVEGTRRGMTDADRKCWRAYVEDLRTADVVVAPTASAARRIGGYWGRVVEVCLPACDPWWELEPTAEHGPAVMDVMRRYDDWGEGKVEEACRQLGLPFAQTGGEATFDRFRAAVRGSCVLVCAYDEASTGGLTLLEGHALGKRVVVSDSRWNGAAELFGDRAHRFRAGDFESLVGAVARAWKLGTSDAESNAAWVREQFSDAAMARRLAAILRGAAR